MRPLPIFNYHRPLSLSEALELMSTLEGARPIAGGTDLLPLMREEGCDVSHLVDVGGLEELSYVRGCGDRILVGAATTHSQLLRSDLIREGAPALWDAVSELASPQIRSRSTIGGNVCNASPAADTAPPLLVHDAEVTIHSRERVRTISIQDLFAGVKVNSLEPGELLTGIMLEASPESAASAFNRITRRRGFTLSVVNAAAYLEMDGEVCRDARVAVGCVAETPIRLPELEKLLRGREIDEELLGEASGVCRSLVKPIDDVRGSAGYRCGMSAVLVRRALNKAWKRI